MLSYTTLAKAGRQLSEFGSFTLRLTSAISQSLPCCVPERDVRVRRRKKRGRFMQEGDGLLGVCDFDYDVDIYVRSNVSTQVISYFTRQPEFAEDLSEFTGVCTNFALCDVHQHAPRGYVDGGARLCMCACLCDNV